MENNPKQGKIRNVKFYLPRAFMFYSLKKEFLTPVLFVIILFIGLITDRLLLLLKENAVIYVITTFLFFFISDICFSIYFFIYLKELKGEDCLLRNCLFSIAKKTFRIFCISFLYFILFTLVIYLFLSFLVLAPLIIIPLTVVYMMFMLNLCYILDQNYRVIESFVESKDTIDGYKTGILRIFFMFIFPVAISMLFVFLIAGASKNEYIFPFILYFVYTVIRFMMQRFKTLLYYDIEYSRKEESNEDEEEFLND